jgi:O-antigen ligase
MTIVISVERIPLQKFSKILALIGILTTLAIDPWFAFDPINLPKMLVLSTGAFFLMSLLILSRISIGKSDLPILIWSAILLLTLVVSYFSNESPWYQQLWGTWGRSTGIITYISLIFVMLGAYFLSSSNSLGLVRVSFDRLGYFMSFYVLIQLMEIDPINWSQKLMIGTLGNLNFMSSFLGMTSVSYTSRIFLEKLNTSAKAFYLFLTTLNLYLILVSQSIQGVGVYFAGFAILLTFYIRKKANLISSLGFLLISVCVGILVLLGTAGIGPLSLLKQSTVLFRLDYWQSGINMVVAHPLNGIGIDSYGDFYREFRTLEAVERTGPQRVTNTAHNIFLDISTGSGIFAGLAFVALMLLTMKSIFGGLKHRVTDIDFQVFSALCVGFVFFSLISINQIGVGVWGFIFMGLVSGFVSRSEAVSTKEGSPRKPFLNRNGQSSNSKMTEMSLQSSKIFMGSALKVGVSGLIALAIFMISLIPNLADARFLAAVRASDLEQAIELISKPGNQDFHVEQLMTKLRESGRDREALELAFTLSQTNPQNWQAWVQIAKSPVASRDQRRNATLNLLRLDPRNNLVRMELESELLP